MTSTARELIEELQQLPDDEQDDAAAALLKRLRKRKKAGKPEEKGTLYESFRVLKDAKLQLAPDASVTYERELYGREVSDEDA